MANDNIFGDPITTPLNATQLGAQLDAVEAGDFDAEVGGFKKIQFTFQPVDGDDAPLGAQQVVRCRMADAAISAELARLQELAGWLSLTGTPAAATRTDPYTFTPVTAGGASGDKTYAITSGALPDGLTLNAATGVVSGTPTVANTFNFDITVTDVDGNTDVLACEIIVAAVPAVTTSSPLAGATVGRSYTANQTSTGGTAPLVWSLASGSMPAGLALNSSTGQITGTPTTPASPATLNMRITDANGTVSPTVSLSLTIAAAVSLTCSTPNGTVGTAYSQVATATGGTAPVAITKPTGTLPNGLSLVDNGDRTATVSGTPTAAGLFSYVLRATDANGSTADLTITNLRVEIAFTPSGATMPNATEALAYSENITSNVGAAGDGPATLAITSGVLPAGLSFLDNGDGTATISGTPDASTAGDYPFTVTATDLNAFSTTHNYTLTVDAAPPPP